MLIIPNPVRESSASAKILVAGRLFCPNGHDLISPRALFDGHPGILIKAAKGSRRGCIALSPVYGSTSRIVLDIDLVKGEIMDLYCPACDILLPIHSPCSCGANLVALFTSKHPDFTDCIAICNRVGCINSHILINDEVISLSMIDTF
ncbi:MAG TPA: hypothetical protein ENN05_11735 [Deltaproteobacteria bacterium]|nr:hypothetical protein [Deltaproteobacteria bacterium]